MIPIVHEHPEAKSSVGCKGRKNATVVVSFLLFSGMQSGQSVEAVIMRHDAGAGKYAGGPRQGGPRATLCVSSQVHCYLIVIMPHLDLQLPVDCQ